MLTLAQARHLRDRIEQLDAGSAERARLTGVLGRLVECAAHLVFEVNERHDFARLQSGRFCRQDRLCAVCASLRSARLIRDYSGRVGEVLKRERPGELKLVLATVTVRNGPDLAERAGLVRDTWSKLIERARNHAKGHRGSSVLSVCLGGVGSMEIKRGSGSGEWHPHMHVLLIVPAWQDADELGGELAAEWSELTNGDSFVCDVRDVRPSQSTGVLRDDLHGAFCEVFKYATKCGGNTPADSFDAWEQLKGWRLIRSFGWLYNVPEPEQLGDAVEPVTFELVERVYRCNAQGYELAAERVLPRKGERRDRFLNAVEQGRVNDYARGVRLPAARPGERARAPDSCDVRSAQPGVDSPGQPC